MIFDEWANRGDYDHVDLDHHDDYDLYLGLYPDHGLDRVFFCWVKI